MCYVLCLFFFLRSLLLHGTPLAMSGYGLEESLTNRAKLGGPYPSGRNLLLLRVNFAAVGAVVCGDDGHLSVSTHILIDRH